MKILAYILTIIASLSAVSCLEPTPIMAKYENGIITYQTITNYKDSKILTAIEENNYKTFFGCDAPMPMNIDAAAEKINEEYAERAKELEELEKYMPYFSCSYDIRQEVSLIRNNKVLCYSTTTHIYEGGAHGSIFKHGKCYDLDTGKLFDLNYLFEGEWGLSMRKLVVKKLINKSVNADCLEDFEFFGEAETLPMYSSAVLHENSIELIYQPYEIAAFAFGIISIEISDEEVLSTGAPLPYKK